MAAEDEALVLHPVLDRQGDGIETADAEMGRHQGGEGDRFGAAGEGDPALGVVIAGAEQRIGAGQRPADEAVDGTSPNQSVII